MADGVDLLLVEVFEHIIAAAHVAIEGGVADGHFRLVAGGHQHQAELVGKRHQGDAADARLDVFLGDVGRAAGEGGRQHGLERRDGRGDSDFVESHAGAFRAGGGVLEAVRTGVARGQHEGLDVVGAQGVAGHDQGNRRIHPAGEAEQDTLEPRFAHIVAQPRHHRVVIGLRRARPVGHRRIRAVPAARSARPGRHRQVFGEHRQAHAHHALRIDGEGPAVEHQFVLAADLVDVDQRQAGFAGALARHLQPLGLRGAAERRTVGHQNDLGPLGLQLGARAAPPDILADRHADLHAAEIEQARLRARREDTLFVEHAIVGQVQLERNAAHLAAVDQGDRVARPTVVAGPGQGDQARAAAGRLARQPL